MFFYSAYGINVQSELLLPELSPGSDSCDVAVRFGPVSLPEENQTDTTKYYDSTNDTVRRFHQMSDGVLLSWSHVGKFYVHGGREVVIDPVDKADEPLIRQIVLGPLFGILLIQRGLAVFHANAISFPTGAALLMARKGYGKSTLSAALHARGHLMITDDVAALRFDEWNVSVIPGIPQLKLWPEAITALKGDPHRYPKVKSELDKRVVPITERFASMACVLKCIYVLDMDQTIEILPLRPKEAFKAVANEWYGALFQGQLLKILGYERHFRESISLIEKVPVFLVKRPLTFGLINNVCQVVECHISTLITSA